MGGGEANRYTGRSTGGMGGWGDGTEMVVPLARVVGARWTGDPVSGWIYRLLSFSGGVSWWACLCGCARSVACGRKGHFRTCRELILVPCSCGLLTCSSVRCLPVSYLFWIFRPLPYHSIYGLIVAVIVSGQVVEENYPYFLGFAHLASGLSNGLSGLAAGICIGIVGDAGVRATGQNPKLYVIMILILIFAEALALYGLIVALILSGKTTTAGC
ncbi:hypothetical protein I4F81_003364 [Pyropia yezoensis]|uniref:Uncharacterized protein n=1 Tax=Pyropia yezoensis TaxID=2788 RepID=A0ACC3BS96_PYRYE|nr:hypothetical protein I4F81_003364 [Neopyropia yezoensis]